MLKVCEKIEKQELGLNHSKIRNLKFRIILLVVCLCVLAIFTGCGVNPATHKPYIKFISDSDEITLGEIAKQYFEKEFKKEFFNNKEIEKYVNYVGQKLVAVSDRPKFRYVFKILNSELLNAFAIPGGHIYITKGLLSRMEKESQLAVILAHEIAHIALRHPVKMIEKSIVEEGPIYTAGYFIKKIMYSKDISNMSYITIQVTDSIIKGGFAIKDEEDADVLTLDYVVKSDYHPYGMLELLEILQKENKESPDLIKDFLKTHPYTGKEISSVKNYIEQKYKKELENVIFVNDAVEFQRVVRAYFIAERINTMEFEK